MRIKLIASLLILCVICSFGSALAQTDRAENMDKTMAGNMNDMTGMDETTGKTCYIIGVIKCSSGTMDKTTGMENMTGAKSTTGMESMNGESQTGMMEADKGQAGMEEKGKLRLEQ